MNNFDDITEEDLDQDEFNMLVNSYGWEEALKIWDERNSEEL